MTFCTRYKPPRSPSIAFDAGTSKTRQEFLAESDVNRLVERFRDTGSFYDPLTLSKTSQNKPLFGDFTNLPDYQQCLDVVIDAEQRFALLPSRLRERFSNDPAQLLAFVSDAKNRDEAIELGLIAKPQEQQVEPPKAAD